MREAAIHACDSALPRETAAGLRLDLDRIVQYVGAELHDDRARGPAVFTCGSRRLWRAFALPAPMPDLGAWAGRHSLRAPGWRCRDSGRLFRTAGPCPECSSQAERACDLGDAAFEEALRQNARFMMPSRPPSIEPSDGMAALLRFPASIRHVAKEQLLAA